MPDIDAIERLLCQRYNVHSLDGGELSAVLAQARGGNTRPLREAIAVREMYRWTAPILEVLGDVEDPEPVVATEPEAEPEPEPVAEVAVAPSPTLRRRGRRR